jgi:hypothetical protein
MRAPVISLALFIALAGCGGSAAPVVAPEGNAQALTRPAAAAQAAAVEPATATASSAVYTIIGNTVHRYDSDGVAVHTGAFAGLSNATVTVYDPDNAWIYFLENASSLGGSPAIVAYNLAGDQETLSGGFPNLPSGSDSLMFDSKNGGIYVGNGSTTGPPIVAYDKDGSPKTLTGSFSGLSGVTGLAFDSYTGSIYATAPNSSPVVQAFTSEGSPVTLSGTFPDVTDPIGVTYDSQSHFVYVMNLNTSTEFVHIYAFNAEGKTVSLKPGFPDNYMFTEIAFDPVNDWFYTINSTLISAFDSEGDAEKLTSPFKSLGQPDDLVVTYQL